MLLSFSENDTIIIPKGNDFNYYFFRNDSTLSFSENNVIIIFKGMIPNIISLETISIIILKRMISSSFSRNNSIIIQENDSIIIFRE